MRPRLLALPIVAASAALLLHARWFDFTCDDAFIAFRYAANWVEHGQIVYNLGERVEGYTSFTWVALLAALNAGGVALPIAAKLLGAASGVLLLVCAAQYARWLMPSRPLGVILLLALVASNACIAAWTLGGLETPLFAALGVASVVTLARWVECGTLRAALLSAAVLVAATLTRPEGATLFACFAAALLVRATWSRRSDAPSRILPRGIAAWAACYLIPCLSYLLWRHAYYGDWLPNTFYLKTSGVGAELRERGLGYLVFCAEELGIVFVAGALLLAFLPRRRADGANAGRVGAIAKSGETPTPATADDASRGVMRAAVRLYTAFTLAYVIIIGGDFLDLYRFIVPLLPLVFGLAVERALSLLGSISLARLHSQRSWLEPMLACALLAWYVPHHVILGKRAKLISEPARKAHGIEPIGWTATYAQRWAATGRWIAAHSKPSDWLAVGAAGAMPYYSRLPNVDTFGLCDAYVARQGRLIGSRPGHQRFAPIDYLLRRAPTFLLINDFATDYPTRLRQDPGWDQRGYVWVEAQVLPQVHQAPAAFYHYFLVRKERAIELMGHPNVRVAIH